MNFKNTMSRVAERMRIDFEDARESTTHKGSKGVAVEHVVVQEFLRKYLPKFLGIGSGEIVTADRDIPEESQVSHAMDIIIYDALRCPIFYSKPNTQTFPNEGVYAVVEVKSMLDSRALEDDIDKLISAKRLPKFAYYEEAIKRSVGPIYGKQWSYFPTLGVIFAFDSVRLGTILEKLHEINERRNLQLHEQIDLIFVLKQGLIYNLAIDTKTGTRYMSCRPTPSSKRGYTTDDRSLLFLYTLLMQQLSQARMQPIQVAKYGDFAGVTTHFG